jgi:homoserine kinase
VSGRVLVRVPASSANLGPGFDVLAAALDIHVEVEVEETGRFAVHTDLAIARDRRNLCVRAFDLLAPAERHEFAIHSDVPLAGGLGTSAAAIVAGLVAADALAGSGGAPIADAGALTERGARLLALASRAEGHPDNAAAALLGGFVLCADGRATRLDPPEGLEPILVVPGRAVRTAKARAALPGEVPRADAVFNVAHASLLVLGLARGDLDLVARGLDDRLHQPPRAPLYPQSAALLSRARELGALGATISGAGPTVLLWARAEEAEAVARHARAASAGWARVHRTRFAPAGASVRAV